MACCAPACDSRPAWRDREWCSEWFSAGRCRPRHGHRRRDDRQLHSLRERCHAQPASVLPKLSNAADHASAFARCATADKSLIRPSVTGFVQSIPFLRHPFAGRSLLSGVGVRRDLRAAPLRWPQLPEFKCSGNLTKRNFKARYSGSQLHQKSASDAYEKLQRCRRFCASAGLFLVRLW